MLCKTDVVLGLYLLPLKDYIMKSEDIQKLVLLLYHEGVNENQIYKHVRGTVSRATIYSWIKSMNTSSTIDMKSPTDRPRIIRNKSLIQKVKQRLSRKKRVSSRILA